MGTSGHAGHASSLGWGRILLERDKFGGECLGIGWKSFVGVSCDAEDCSWGCVLNFTGS